MKLNLGSGPSGIDGWINYDWGVLPLLSKIPYVRRIVVNLGFLPNSYDVDWPKIKLVDIRRRFPMQEEVVDYIYCSNVLEHFEKWEAEKILKEARRVLKKNGTIRIVLPDLKKLISKYESGDDFCREFYGFQKDIKTWNKLFIRGHQWMYDIFTFSSLLKTCGFGKIKVLKIKEGKVPDIAKLDLEIHEELCFYIEAEKT